MHRAVWAAKRAHWKSWAWTRRMLRAAKVTPARFDALFVLSERGVMMQSKLQRLLGVVRSTVSELLRDLERLRLVARGPRFRGGRDVRLTQAGREAVDRAWEAQSRVDDEVTEAFGSPWSLHVYTRILVFERFCRHLRRACGDLGYSRVYGWMPYEE